MSRANFDLRDQEGTFVAEIEFVVSDLDGVVMGEIGDRQLTGSELGFWIEAFGSARIIAKALEQSKYRQDPMAMAKSQREYAMDDDKESA